MKIIKLVLRVFLALIFLTAGIFHFIISDTFARIMPPIFPFPLFWVYLSGIFEIGLAIMLLIPTYGRIAAWGLIVLLIAVFPANIYMALNLQLFPEIGPAALYWRLPVQFILIAWAFWFTREERK